MRPKTEGILESSLYVSDLARSIHFYESIFGFRVISDFGQRGCALEAGNRQVLLLFKKGASRAITAPHDGGGELHLAFAIRADDCRNGKPGSPKKESRWKRRRNGNWAARAFTSAIQIGI